MNYNKNLIDDLFEIKEKQNEKDKQIIEKFIEQYNKMYVEYRQFQNDKIQLYKELGKEINKNTTNKRKRRTNKEEKIITTKTVFFEN